MVVRKNKMMERIVLRDIDLHFNVEKIAETLRAPKHSDFYEELKQNLPIAEMVVRPRAVLKWCSVDEVKDEMVTISGTTFVSKVMSDKLIDKEKVFLYVVTAGNEISTCDKITSSIVKNMIETSALTLTFEYVIKYIENNFKYKKIAALNPGSLTDWPIINNKEIFNIIGDVTEDTGVQLTTSYYMNPHQSISGILFENGGDYTNCSLCKKFDCIGRRQAFDKTEYKRIFG